MEIYIEIIYILNSIILFYAFEILFFLLNCHASLNKLFHYVITYNISIILLYIDLFQGFILFYYLVLIIIYFKSNAYIYYPLFIFIYMSILSFMNMVIKNSSIYQGILLVESMSMSLIIFLCLFILSLIYFFIYYYKTKIQDYKVTIIIKGQKYIGLIDTGNHASYKGYPIIFVNKSICTQHEIIDYIEIRTLSGYKSIAIIKMNNIKINNRLIESIYAGIMENNEYDFILNNKILGGML